MVSSPMGEGKCYREDSQDGQVRQSRRVGANGHAAGRNAHASPGKMGNDIPGPGAAGRGKKRRTSDRLPPRTTRQGGDSAGLGARLRTGSEIARALRLATAALSAVRADHLQGD